MSEQDNQKIGKSGNFLAYLVIFFVLDLFSGFKTLSFVFQSGIFVTLIVGFGVYFVYKLLKSSDDSKEDMENTMAKYLPMCRSQVEDWIPTEDELMLEEVYRRRAEYHKEHPDGGEWRNFKNASYRAAVYNRRKKRAEAMAKRLAKQEIKNKH